jgi:hypothetical protein
MDRVDRLTVVLCLGAIAIIWAYPSWIHEFALGGVLFRGKLGASWIWSPPMPYGTEIDWTRGLLLTGLVAFLGCGVMVWRWMLREMEEEKLKGEFPE